MKVYNLFRTRGRHGLICAVPETHAVPSFVIAPYWDYAGRLEGTSPVLGFDRKAAEAGLRYNGFHLFPDFRLGAL